MNNYKQSYKCDCGCDYGSCGRRNFFILTASRSTDYYILYHKVHADDPHSKLEEIFSCGDNGIEALSKLLDCSNSTENLDDDDYSDLKFNK